MVHLDLTGQIGPKLLESLIPWFNSLTHLNRSNIGEEKKNLHVIILITKP